MSDRLEASFASLLGWFSRAVADPTDSDDLRLRKGLLLLISAATLPVALVWGSLYLLVMGSPIGWVPYVYFVVSLAAILIFIRTHNFGLFLFIEQLDILLAPTLSAIPLGGFAASGGVGLWAILAPMAALVFSDVRSGVRWFVAFLVVFLAAGAVGGIVAVEALPAWFNSAMVGLNIAVSSIIVFMLLGFFVRQRQEALAALRVEQEKAEDLLLNMLPSSIAARLKAQPQTIADQVGAATILFADVVDFTPFSQSHAAAEVVGTLDDLFSRFDELAEKHGLEKIKTIGDCYMVAAGVPSPRPDHATAIAQMALEMLDAVRADDDVGRLGLELRIGINSGPVIAGVIGRKRFLYDLWGDAVNTASRMESHGTPGDIQITGATYDLIKHEFECRRRGMIEVKGKGEMETWYLTGARNGASRGSSGATPRRSGTTDGRPTAAEQAVR